MLTGLSGEAITAERVREELDALETTYRDRSKKLRALLRVLEAENGDDSNEQV
jgi:hypothetical protein